jgi:hypothetical protein
MFVHMGVEIGFSTEGKNMAWVRVAERLTKKWTISGLYEELSWS